MSVPPRTSVSGWPQCETCGRDVPNEYRDEAAMWRLGWTLVNGKYWFCGICGVNSPETTRSSGKT